MQSDRLKPYDFGMCNIKRGIATWNNVIQRSIIHWMYFGDLSARKEKDRNTVVDNMYTLKFV